MSSEVAMGSDNGVFRLQVDRRTDHNGFMACGEIAGTALPPRARSSIMRHFNITEYIRRSMSRFDGEDPLPLAGRAAVDGIGLFAAVLPRLDALDRFCLFVTICRSEEH